jgi:hypothetical protein
MGVQPMITVIRCPSTGRKFQVIPHDARAHTPWFFSRSNPFGEFSGLHIQHVNDVLGYHFS